jgi:hypothetical protein
MLYGIFQYDNTRKITAYILTNGNGVIEGISECKITNKFFFLFIINKLDAKLLFGIGAKEIKEKTSINSLVLFNLFESF